MTGFTRLKTDLPDKMILKLNPKNPVNPVKIEKKLKVR
jgi:hypothetical protein